MPKKKSKSSGKARPAGIEETLADRKKRARCIYNRLVKAYPDATCALHHENPFQLLVATILSAQCTDVRVNMVTPALFRKYPDPARMARARRGDLEAMIRSTGFYRNKARALQEASKDVVTRFGGRVPATMEDLLSLHGVARKTANVVLGNAFGVEAGIVVDTHVGRLSRRMGLTAEKDPVKVEQDLMALFPRKQWTLLAHLLIWHGRAVCSSRKPDCTHCPVAAACPRLGVTSQPG